MASVITLNILLLTKLAVGAVAVVAAAVVVVVVFVGVIEVASEFVVVLVVSMADEGFDVAVVGVVDVSVVLTTKTAEPVVSKKKRHLETLI